MKKYIFVILVLLACLFSIINTSGWGIAYETPYKTNVLISFWCLFLIGKGRFVHAIEYNSILAFFTLLSFVILPWLTADSWDGFTYLMMVPLVYCFSEQKYSYEALRLSGYAVAFWGLAVLFVYSRTGILSGWNDNQISMIGLFSYIYYSISLYGNMSGRKFSIGIAISILYILMLNATQSRSAIIFIVVAVLLAYSGGTFQKLIKRKKFLFYALNLPLFISLFFIFLPGLFIFQYFEEWSLQHFGKSAMNGRDILWMEGYERLCNSYFIGEGEFLINHHNSAVAVISVFGVVGYICWYKLLAKPLKFMLHYVDDNLMFGFVTSFFLIFWQQSFDLGFISASPNMIPYVILGLGLARARVLKKRKKNVQEVLVETK